jgi:hypothetical protein
MLSARQKAFSGEEQCAKNSSKYQYQRWHHSQRLLSGMIQSQEEIAGPKGSTGLVKLMGI